MTVVDAFALIAEPRRRRILELVWREERAAGEIAAGFDVSFSAVSQHLGVLKRAGLIEERQEGRRRLYRARREALGPLAGVLEAMWAEKLGTLKSLAEVEQRSIDRAGSGRTQTGGIRHDGHE